MFSSTFRHCNNTSCTKYIMLVKLQGRAKTNESNVRAKRFKELSRKLEAYIMPCFFLVFKVRYQWCHFHKREKNGCTIRRKVNKKFHHSSFWIRYFYAECDSWNNMTLTK